MTKRTETAWNILGCVGAAALMVYLFIIGPVLIISGTAW
jgi:hypothetical protein